MIENTIKTEVEAGPEELWEKFLMPKEFVRLIPGIKDVEDLGDGSYMVEMSVLSMSIKSRVREKIVEKPKVVELESGDPYFHLVAKMEKLSANDFVQNLATWVGNNRTTKVDISVELDPPTFFGILDRKIESELGKRMKRNVSRMKKEAEGG